jgi:S-adenosylmethionine:tRNA ribosyltransferase-isomerase
MDVRQFDFELPPELIAQEPPAERSAARLLTIERQTGVLDHRSIADLPDLLRAGDLVVVNNTRVFAARLLGRRVPSGGAVECLLICLGSDPRQPQVVWGQTRDNSVWQALMHPGQKLKPGARVVFEPPDSAPGPDSESDPRPCRKLYGEVLERLFFGRRLIRLWTEDGSDVDTTIDAIGHVPLPPYIRRADQASDRERYQTVFARKRGSVAAPTAGLHFTPQLLTTLRAGGVEIAEITLHVGYGTFQPVRVDRVEDHTIEAEQYEISEAAADAIERARVDGRRIIAVGTTTTRTLEAVARAHNGRVVAGSGTTDLFIYPGVEFRVVRGLLTNFHLPQSSLLMLVSAFGGFETVMTAYRAAVERRYRFYSYGDAMLLS